MRRTHPRGRATRTNFLTRSVTCSVALAVLCLSSHITLASTGVRETRRPTGILAVRGEVSVNDMRAVTGATLFSESVIRTGQRSDARINLGALGVVELLPGSSLALSFTEKGLDASLEAGGVRLQAPAGVGARVRASDGSLVIAADRERPNSFSVSVACDSATHVRAERGGVEWRMGANVRLVASGEEASSATTSGAVCAPASLSAQSTQGGGGDRRRLGWLLLAIGGAVALAIGIAAARDDEIETPPDDGCVIILSGPSAPC